VGAAGLNFRDTIMSADKTDKAGEIAKKIWLAGLGAYGKAYDNASERYTAASKEVPQQFNELVEKGLELQQQTRDQISETREHLSEQISDTREQLTEQLTSIPKPSLGIEERIEKMRDYLNRDAEAGSEVNLLQKQIKALSSTVALLQSQLKGTVTPKAKTKAKAKKKPATKKLAAKQPASKAKAKSKAKAAAKPKTKAKAKTKAKTKAKAKVKAKK